MSGVQKYIRETYKVIHRYSKTNEGFVVWHQVLTLRRLNTDTFASVCIKMAIFKMPENYPKDMQNSLSFRQLIDHIGEASEWVLVTKFPVVRKIQAVKFENAKKNPVLWSKNGKV